MLISRDQIVDLLQSLEEPERAERAARELPDLLDTVDHGDQLRDLGLDPGSVRDAFGAQPPELGGLLGGR